MQLLQMKHQLARLSLSGSSNSSVAAGDHASWQAFGCGTSNAEPSTSIEPPLSASVSSLTVGWYPFLEDALEKDMFVCVYELLSLCELCMDMMMVQFKLVKNNCYCKEPFVARCRHGN